MIDLNKIKLGYSPLSDSIYLYRHGANPSVALDKRYAESDVLVVVTEMMMDDAPNGATKDYILGKNRYRITVKPIKFEEAEI